MPADPRLNEQQLLSVLKDEDQPMGLDHMRFLSNVVLLACYDRKIGREPFAEIIATCSDITNASMELEKCFLMGEVMSVAAPGRKSEKLAEIMKMWGKAVTAGRRKLAAQFELVSQCPTTKDTVS